MSRQINVRLDDADVAALEAAAFVDGRSLSDEARTALLLYIAQLKEDSDVQEMLEIKSRRAGDKAAAAAPVSSLEARRDQSRKRA